MAEPGRVNLGEFMSAWQREGALKVRTIVPARVLEYHDGPPSTTKLEVSAQQIEQASDGTRVVRESFVLDDVPVWQYGGTQSYIRAPLATGDTGVILVCDRSIGSWRTDGLAHPPPAPWLHNLGECVFLPGFRPDALTNQPLPATMGGLVIEAQAIQLGIGATQSFVLGQMFDVMWGQLIAYVTTHTHTVPIVGAPGTTPSSTPIVIPPVAAPDPTLTSVLSTKVFGE